MIRTGGSIPARAPAVPTGLKIGDRLPDHPRVRAWSRDRLRWLTSPFQADLADRAARALLRRNVFFVAWVLSVGATLSTMLTDADPSGRLRTVQYACLAGEAAMGLVLVLHGRRMGDLVFSLLLLAGNAMAVVGVASHSHLGDVPRTGMLFVSSIVMGAIFLEGGRWVAAQQASVIGLLLLLTPRNPDLANRMLDLSTNASGLLIIGVSVRLLRDLAIRSVVEARRGEVTDPLTGLVNRRGMERQVDTYWRRHAHESRPVLALAVDVDRFKEINDTQGHAAGDEVLRRLGELLAASVRGNDIAVRLGGEEFLVLCEAPAGEAARIAERLRRTVELELAPVTVSIGVHEAHPRSTDVLPEAVWDAVKVADDALYQAKRHGRNCVALA